MEPISLEKLIERYSHTAVRGARALGLNDFASIAADDFRGKTFDWVRKVLAGIEPSIFTEQKIDYSRESAERVAQFLLDMPQLGYAEPVVRTANSIHIQRIRRTYVPLERVIAQAANNLGIELGTLEDTLFVDYVKAQITTFPTAFGDMRFVHERSVGYFRRNLEYEFGKLIREKEERGKAREKALNIMWKELRGNAEPASIIYKEPEEKKYTPPAGQLKLPFLFTKEVYTGLVTVLRQLQAKQELYSSLAGLLNHLAQVKLEKQNEQMMPYVNELIEIAKAGIAGYDQSKPVSVALVWDREDYKMAVNGVVGERVIEDLAAKSGIAPQNAAELKPSELVDFLVDKESYALAIKDLVTMFNVLPGETAKLNPVQLTALIIDTLPVRYEREGFSQGEHLQLMGQALHLYKAISAISEAPFPQGEMPLRFFRENFPRMIGGSGYTLASIALQNFAQESILDERFRLRGDELPAIIRNIKSNPDINDVLQDFHTWDGLKAYLFAGDKEANEQIREVVWKSVPRLIEGKGYVRYHLGRLPFVDAELAKHGHIDGLVERFQATADGNAYYIVPDGQKQLEYYNLQLARQEGRAERRAEEQHNRQAAQQAERQPQVNHAPHLPIKQPRIEENAETPNLETKVTDVEIVNADAPNEEYQHEVYLYLSELRTNLDGMLNGNRRSKQAVLVAVNRINNCLNRLTEPVGQDVTSQLGEMVKDARSVKKVGETVVWNKIAGLHEDYVETYGSLASRISYNLGKLVGRQ